MVLKQGMFHGEKPERSSGIGEGALESQVAAALAADGSLDASSIAVFVNDTGELMLTGAVGSLEESSRAADIARSVAGVQAVDNRISIGLGSGLEDVATVA